MIDSSTPDHKSDASDGPVGKTWQDRHHDRAGPGVPPAGGWTEHSKMECGSFEAGLMELHEGQEAIFASRAEDMIYLVVEGCITLVIDGQSYEASFADFVSVPAGAEHSIANKLSSAAILCRLSGQDNGYPKPTANAEHMKWTAYRDELTWTLPLADQEGHRRGSGPAIRTRSLRGHIVSLPPDQAAPWHNATRNLLFMPLTGSIEVAAANRKLVLSPRDMLLMPAYTPYSYSNRCTTESLFLSIGPNVETQAKRTYFTSDPGWPVRADAATLAV